MSFFRRRKSSEEEFIEGEIIEEPAEQAAAAAPAERKRGFFRRRQKEEAPEAFEPPLERVAPDVPTPDEVEIKEFTRPGEKASRFSLPRLLVWREIRPNLLLLALGLVIGGIFWTLHNLGRLANVYEEWWAAALLAYSLIWAVISLAARRAQSFLAASGLGGISVSLLLHAQGFADWRDTMAGIVLIALGLGIIARGLLLRQGSVAH